MRSWQRSSCEREKNAYVFLFLECATLVCGMSVTSARCTCLGNGTHDLPESDLGIQAVDDILDFCRTPLAVVSV